MNNLLWQDPPILCGRFASYVYLRRPAAIPSRDFWTSVLIAAWVCQSPSCQCFKGQQGEKLCLALSSSPTQGLAEDDMQCQILPAIDGTLCYCPCSPVFITLSFTV